MLPPPKVARGLVDGFFLIRVRTTSPHLGDEAALLIGSTKVATSSIHSRGEEILEALGSGCPMELRPVVIHGHEPLCPARVEAEATLAIAKFQRYLAGHGSICAAPLWFNPWRSFLARLLIVRRPSWRGNPRNRLDAVALLTLPSDRVRARRRLARTQHVVRNS